MMKKQTELLWQGDEPARIRAGETVRLKFSLREVGRNARLMLRGEPASDLMHLSERGSELFCRDIDDALSTDARTGRFSLRFPAWEDPDPRRAWYRLVCRPLTYPGGFPIFKKPEGDRWRLSVFVKAEDFCPAGEACLRVERFVAREGRDPKDISGEATETLVLSFDGGSYGWRRLETELCIPEDTACLLFCVSVANSTGTLWVDSPMLCGAEEQSLLPSFAPASARCGALSWTAENLARYDRTEMRLTLNGRDLGKRALFASIFPAAQTELSPSEGLLRVGENELELTYVPDHFCPYPYLLRRVMLCSEPCGGDFSVVACPHTAAIGRDFSVAVETFCEKVTLTLRSDSAAVVPERETVTFSDAGLHAVRFSVVGAAGAVTLTLSDGKTEETVTLARTVRKTDRVLVGTSDAVYIPQTEDAMREFVKTYLAGEWGNFITFRPVYHWSGTRICNAAVWRRLVRFLAEAHIPYVLLFDERELEGMNANPTREMLEGPYFLGFQGHERDGAYYYWEDGMFGADGELYRALRARKLDHPDVSYRMPPKYRNGKGHLFYDIEEFTDTASAAATFQKNLDACMRGIARHTGVTLLFRHFLRAGVEEIGAELMYGNHEILLSGLRGSALAYGKTETLAHLALQWHAVPVGGAFFLARYALSLRLAYLHGVTQINTEEGLWWSENGAETHDRFSEVCGAFAETERRFLRYVEGHSRSGEIAHRHALLYGENENFPAYTYESCPAWHKAAPGWEYGASERAWRQLRLFYPTASMTHPNAEERRRARTDGGEPGWYSPTPLGLCEILPIEAPDAVLDRYPYLAFVGYNTASAEQLERLIGYVRRGGKLLLCLCHLSTDTDRGNSHSADYCTALIDGYERLTGDVGEWDGHLHRHRLGKGEVQTVTSCAFPVPDTPCGETFAAALRALAEESDRSAAVRVETNGARVEYAVWQEADGRTTVRLCGVGWDETDRIETVRIKTETLTCAVSVRPCEITAVTVSADQTLAIATEDENGETLALTREDGGVCLTLQGEGVCRFRLFGLDPSEDGRRLELEPCGICTVHLEE